MNHIQYIWEAKVRDYELDSQSIVNHATFVNYFEQGRNDFARSLGVDHLQYYQAGFALVISDITIKYRLPLKAGDEFYVTSNIAELTGTRLIIAQELRLKHSDHLIAKASVDIACINLQTRRSGIPDMLKDTLAHYFSNQSAKGN
ncbi:MAG TPA: thioesterase family protein [Gammaproteobacteria bacterium]|nr:thioesterase family protein [Gammaproteobacteria bacterium]